jgi:hypothetical protein
MAAFGEFRPILGEMARYLRIISNAQCGTPSQITLTGGTGNIPAGFNSISIVATTVPATLTYADGSTYTLSVVGESIKLSASEGGTLPAITVTAGAIKWTGIK